MLVDQPPPNKWKISKKFSLSNYYTSFFCNLKNKEILFIEINNFIKPKDKKFHFHKFHMTKVQGHWVLQIDIDCYLLLD